MGGDSFWDSDEKWGPERLVGSLSEEGVGDESGKVGGAWQGSRTWGFNILAMS